MAYEMRPGQGSLFRNEKKTEERQPGYKGKLMLPNGEVRWVSCWAKKTSAGEIWLSLSVGELVQGQGSAPAKANEYTTVSDDDIPF